MNTIRNLYHTSEQIKMSSRKVKYFIHHAKRCKKDSDTVKLILLTTLESAYCSTLVAHMNDLTKELQLSLYGK